MSLASNVSAEINKGTTSTMNLREIRDEVERFNEIDCASFESSLGRYSSKDTLGVLKNFQTLVIKMLN